MKKRFFGIAASITMLLGSVFMLGNIQETQAKEAPYPPEMISSNPYICIDYSWDCKS